MYHTSWKKTATAERNDDAGQNSTIVQSSNDRSMSPPLVVPPLVSFAWNKARRYLKQTTCKCCLDLLQDSSILLQKTYNTDQKANQIMTKSYLSIMFTKNKTILSYFIYSLSYRISFLFPKIQRCRPSHLTAFGFKPLRPRG